MSDHRDPQLSRLIAELDAPEHGSSFWTSLRADLEEASPTLPDAPGPVAGDRDVVELSRRGASRSAPPWLLAAAAALVAVLVGVGVLASGGDEPERTGVATDPTGGERRDPAPDGGVGVGGARVQPVGAPIQRGAGRVVATDPSGRFLYVTDVAPDGGSGCEGAPAEALYVEPVGDPADRRLAVPSDVVDATGGVELRFGDGGEVAVLPRCEGFGAALVTGRLSASGAIVDAEELVVRDVDLGRSVDGIVDLEFARPGVLVVATFAIADDGTDHRHVYELPTSAGEVVDLELDGTVALDVTEDGTLATLDTDGNVFLGDRLVGPGDGAHGLVVSGDGTSIATVGPGGVRVHPTAGGAVREIALENPSEVQLLDGGVLVVDEHVGDAGAVRVVAFELGDDLDPVTLVELGDPGRGFVAAVDLGAVYVNVDIESHGVVLEQRLRR